jgi:hypothetical protein
MVYNTQNYWVTSFCPLSGILYSTKKKQLFENLMMETDSVSETLCSFVFFRILDGGQSPKTH